MLEYISKSCNNRALHRFYHFQIVFLVSSNFFLHSCSCNSGFNSNRVEELPIRSVDNNESLDANHFESSEGAAEHHTAHALVKGLTEAVKESNDPSEAEHAAPSPSGGISKAQNWASREELSLFFEPSDYYQEVIKLVKMRQSLQGSWIKYNKPFIRGFELGKKLGVISDKKDVLFKRHTDIELLMDRISSFEELLMHRQSEFERGEINKTEFLEVMEDFSSYAIALAMVRTMLETKLPDGTHRYVEDGRPYAKPRIKHEVATFLRKKTNLIFNKIEQLKLVNSEDSKMLASPLNLIKCKPFIEKSPKIFGVNKLNPLDPFTEEYPLIFKKKLIPGSILWTWINSKSLRNGSWDSPLMNRDTDRSIGNILKSLEEASEVYLETFKSEKHFSNEDPDDIERVVIKRFEKLNEDPIFNKKYTKGKEAIVFARKILEKKKSYDIGRPLPTEGLQYVGNWRTDDTTKQISVSQAENMVDILDILSAFYVFVESEGAVKPPLYHSRLVRNFNKEKFWVFESPEEQSKRESKSKNILNALLLAALILSGLSAVAPGVGIGFAIAVLSVRAVLGMGAIGWALF